MALAVMLLVALALSQVTTPALAAVTAAVAVLLTTMAVLTVGSRTLTVGSRARAHRELLSSLPAPAHPTTAGRPRTRAPSVEASAT